MLNRMHKAYMWAAQFAEMELVGNTLGSRLRSLWREDGTKTFPFLAYALLTR